MELATRLAALLMRPIGYIDDSHCHLESLSAEQIKAMMAHRFFRASVNRAVAAKIGFTSVKIDEAMLARLISSPSSRLAAMIVTAPMQEIRRVAWSLAPAVLSKRICAIVLKSDRDLARKTLDAEGFDIATREVPILYAPLCELDAKSNEGPLFSKDADLAVEREQIMTLGIQTLGSFLDAAEPVLGNLFALRLPLSANYAERRQFVRSFDEIHCDQVARFIRRRQPSWSAIIG
jgi:hypothetical protein